jgi:hypothetical protein
MISPRSWKFLHRRTITGPGRNPLPIIRRWTLIETPLFGIKVHHIIRSDPQERGFHDHPWNFVSLRLATRYTENILGPEGEVVRQETKRLTFRKSTTPHRLDVPAGAKCWTIMITGPRSNNWRVFAPKRDSGEQA